MFYHGYHTKMTFLVLRHIYLVKSSLQYMNILAIVITVTVYNVVYMVSKNRLFGDCDEKSLLFLIGSKVFVFRIAT